MKRKYVLPETELSCSLPELRDLARVVGADQLVVDDEERMVGDVLGERREGGKSRHIGGYVV